jgi:hypothetical protein
VAKKRRTAERGLRGQPDAPLDLASAAQNPASWIRARLPTVVPKKKRPRRDIPGPIANKGGAENWLLKSVVIAALSEGIDPAGKPRLRYFQCSSHVDLPRCIGAQTCF